LFDWQASDGLDREEIELAGNGSRTWQCESRRQHIQVSVQAKEQHVACRKLIGCVLYECPSIAAEERHVLSPEGDKRLGAQLPSQAVEKALMSLEFDMKLLPQGHCEP